MTTVEDLNRVLPPLEFLEGFRLEVLNAAVIDPAKEWASSRSSMTVDKRVLSSTDVGVLLRRSEKALHEELSTLFASVREVLAAYTSGDHKSAAHLLIKLGAFYEDHRALSKARQTFASALQISLPLQDRECEIIALRRIGRVLKDEGHLIEALEYYRRSESLAVDINDAGQAVIARTGCGNVLTLQGKLWEAESSYRDALELTKQAADDDELAVSESQILINLGMLATLQGRNQVARDWLSRAKKKLTSVESPVDQGIYLRNLAALEWHAGKHEESQQLFMTALALPIPTFLRASIATDLVESFLRSNQVALAAEYGERAEEYAIASRSVWLMARMYRALGMLSVATGNPDGVTFFEKSLELAVAKQLPFLEAETLIEYAVLRRTTGDQEEAEAYLQRAEQICRGIGAVTLEGRVRDMLAEVDVAAA
ncbi:MAG: tetratricopeptide repeat protein [Longimicrobiaceae bacterium]